jgi:hypothetical protein
MKRTQLGHKLSWYPQLPDFRDFKYEHHAESKLLSIPTKIDRRLQQSPVRDQGDVGDCTAFSTAAGLEELEIAEIAQKLPLQQSPEVFHAGTFDPMSCAFIYAVTRIYEGIPITEDSGASIRDVILAIRHDGICDEPTWPTTDQNVFTVPSQAAYNLAAYHNGIFGYSLDNTNIMSLKKCLASGYGFIFGASLYSSFESQQTTSTGMVTMPGLMDDYLGGHAIYCCGYDDSTHLFIVKNSWGTSVGSNGYYFFPYNYLTNPDLCSDFWTLRRTASNVGSL